MLRLDDNIISRLCKKCFSEIPQSIERCSVGQGNYVFIVQLTDTTYVIRCSPEKNAYNDTVYWLEIENNSQANNEIPTQRMKILILRRWILFIRTVFAMIQT